MKTKLPTLMFVLSVILASGCAWAQKKAPSWTATVKNPVNWQRVHSLGYILAGTNGGLYCMNPIDGKIMWENTGFAALDAGSFAEVPGTEFATIAYKQDPGATIPMQAVLDVVSGKVLFDSQKEKIGVLSRHVLKGSGRLLIIGVRQDGKLNTALFMYDIASGAPIWSNETLFTSDQPAAKGLLGKLQALGNQLGSIASLTSEPVELPDQTMIITHPNFVFRINSADGKVVWKQSIQPSKKAQVIFSPFRKEMVFVGTEVESSSGSSFSSGSQAGQPNKFYYNYYYSFDLATGKPTWKEPGKENDMLNRVIAHEMGLIICPRSTQKPTINIVDYETGKTLWGNKGKGIKAQGSVVNYIETEKGYLITTAFDNAWNDKAEEYYLNVLDPATGTLRYEKSIKLKGDLVRTEMVPKGLLFVTTREVNILDPNTGTLAWPESIEAGSSLSDKPRPFPTGEGADGKIYVYSPKEAAVMEVDKQAGSFRRVTTAKIEFQGKELPKQIDVKTDGIILSSDQNIMKIGFDGAVKYAKYYPAPRESGLMRALYAAQAIRAAYIGAAATQASAAFAQASAKSTDPMGKELGSALSKGYAQLGEAGFSYSSRCMKEFSARYKASQTSPDFVIMMTPQEKKGHRLVQVSKQTGEITASIDINNDKEPEYELDEIYNFIYYRPTPNDIVCYKL